MSRLSGLASYAPCSNIGRRLCLDFIVGDAGENDAQSEETDGSELPQTAGRAGRLDAFELRTFAGQRRLYQCAS